VQTFHHYATIEICKLSPYLPVYQHLYVLPAFIYTCAKCGKSENRVVLQWPSHDVSCDVICVSVDVVHYAERAATDGYSSALSGWPEGEAAEDVCQEVQGLFQVILFSAFL